MPASPASVFVVVVVAAGLHRLAERAWRAPRAPGGARRGGGRPSPAGRRSRSAVAKVAVRPVSPTTRVCAACASSSNCSRSAAATGGSGRPSSATHSAVWRAISQLTGPVDCSIRITWPRSICEKSNVDGSNSPPEHRRRTRKRGKAGTSGEFVGLRRGLRVEDVSATRSVYGRAFRSPSPAPPGSSGSHLLPVLADHPDVERVVGLDVREPERRPANARVPPGRHRRHRAQAAARGHRRGRAPRRRRRPDPRRGADGAGQRRGHPPRARRPRRRSARGAIVRISSATVYGAWPNNPVPLTEDAPLRPNPHFSPAVQGAEVERLLAEWRADHPDVTVTTLRSAPVVGPGRRAPPGPDPARPSAAARARRGDAGAGRARRRPRVGARARGHHATSPACSTSRPTAGSTPTPHAR